MDDKKTMKRKALKKILSPIEESYEFNLEDDFNYIFSNDYWLFLLLIIIEKSKEGINDLAFNSFLKSSYWGEEITDDFSDLHDYESVENYIYENIIGTICSDLKIATIGIDRKYFYNFTSVIIDNAMQGNNSHLHDPEFYIYTLESYYNIRNTIDGDNQVYIDSFNINRNPFLISINDKEKYSKFFDNFLYIACFLPECIFLRIKWNRSQIEKIEENIFRMIKDFTQNKFLDDSIYYKDEMTFSDQIDKFHDYVCGLKIINNIVKIPLDSLLNKDFSIIKILKYLELNDIAEIEKWDVNTFWKVTFKADPKDISMYTSQSFVDGTTFKNDILYFNGRDYHFPNQLNQKLLLSILFSEPNKEWTYDEISEK